MKYYILLILLFYSCDRRQPVTTGMEGKLLPALEFLCKDSTTHFNTGQTPTGLPIVLLYFNPQCPYCRAEMSSILSNKSLIKDIKFYLLTSAPIPALNAFYTTYELQKYPNIYVGIDFKHTFENVFNGYAVPYTVIFNKDKKLVHAFLGQMHSAQIRDIAED